MINSFSTTVTMQDSATATGNGTYVSVADRAFIVMQVSGTFTATITFEGTVDESNWVAIQATNLNDGSVATIATSAGLYAAPAAGLTRVRARISSYTSGSVTVTGHAIAEGPGATPPALTHGFNDSTWDPIRNNVELTLLSSAARTATTNSSDQINYNAKGAIIFFDITAVPLVDTVTLSVEGKDPVSGKYFTLLEGSALSTTGQRLYAIYPGVADTDTKFDAFEEMPMPRTWRVTVTHSGIGSFTYSVGAAMIL